MGAPEAPREGAVGGTAGGAREGAANGTAGEAEGKAEEPRDGAATPQRSAAVERACGEAGKILEMLRKGNRKKGRPMGRSMGALDEILHGQLKLLHIPRSA